MFVIGQFCWNQSYVYDVINMFWIFLIFVWYHEKVRFSCGLFSNFDGNIWLMFRKPKFVDKSRKIVYIPVFRVRAAQSFVFYVVFCRSLLVHFRLVIVFLRHTASDYAWGIFKPFLRQKLYCDSHEDIWNSLLDNSTLEFPISHVTKRRTTFKFPMLNSSLKATLKNIPFLCFFNGTFFLLPGFWKI